MLMETKSNQPLPPEWFARPVLEVTPALIGKTLCRRLSDGNIMRHPINEVEAYDGTADKACHASKGRTARTEVMFGPAGHFYIYLCYGVHWLLNIVTNEPDYPAAVLIRGVGPYHGPGKLTKALAITRDQNSHPAHPGTGLWIEDAPEVEQSLIQTTPRIGVNYAGEPWVSKPWRWIAR